MKINYSILLDQDELLTNFNCGFYGEAVAQHLINLSKYELTVPPAASPLASASAPAPAPATTPVPSPSPSPQSPQDILLGKVGGFFLSSL